MTCRYLVLIRLSFEDKTSPICHSDASQISREITENSGNIAKIMNMTPRVNIQMWRRHDMEKPCSVCGVEVPALKNLNFIKMANISSVNR